MEELNLSIEEGNELISAFLKKNTEEIYKLFGPDNYDNDWSKLMEVVAEMNKSPWWDEYEISDLSIALVSADIKYTWNLIINALLKYQDYEKEL